MKITNHTCRLFILCSLLTAIGLPATHALNIENARSPREQERPMRRTTRYIVLHTTEAPERSSLNKLRANGEAHYLVGLDGNVYRIMHHRRKAYHAGRSMWEGHDGLDDYSIGIEVVGYHDREITPAQYDALRKLLDELKAMYKIPDKRVLTHSMVAYGRPNRWHKRSHRGRKRCGMVFARDSVRKRLGLTSKPAFDPDVRAGRLVFGDEALSRVLYGGPSTSEKQYHELSRPRRDVISEDATPWNLAGAAYNKRETTYIYPDGREFRGDQIKNWRAIPKGTRVVLHTETASAVADAPPPPAPKPPDPQPVRLPPAAVKVFGVDGNSASDLAGAAYDQPHTVYFLPDGRMRRGDEFTREEWNRIPRDTVVLIGYQYGGRVTASRNAFSIRGDQWNSKTTLYRLADGCLVPGNQVAERHIPNNALVFYRD